MSWDVYFEQRQGAGPRVLRHIVPSAYQELGFDANKKLVARAPGGVIAKTISFVEDATSLTHTGTVAIPAGATLHDIQVDAGALWTATTAVMKIGDTADDDGYFIGVNLKATDLLVGEQLRIASSTMWGGKEGAYLVAATGQRGPTTANFGGKYVAGSNITAIITVGTPATTVGRTYVTVLYSTGEAITPVLA